MDYRQIELEWLSISEKNNSGKYFYHLEEPMQPHVTALKTDRKEWAPQQLLEQWRQHLQRRDRSAGTIRKYTQAVASFCVWYEQEEQAPLQLSTLTPGCQA